ncbi:BLOC-1-related complex subunit 7 isoform X3 [Felis catus]|uniref:BLOC-1-related complex subunit 7 n=1 Tax=Felis catus TaxID=9685 RepID=A0ABI7W3H4_FELCA|nr:BLOC-1-related complex subunit 7 isoform X3 [Felis catus]
MATGTPDSQARFGQSVKGLLTEKVNTCGTDVIALTKQVLKGSRSSEEQGATIGQKLLSISSWLSVPTESHLCSHRPPTQIRAQLLCCQGPAISCWVRQPATWYYRKMPSCTQKMQEAIQKNVEQSSDLQDQLNHLLK